MPRKAALTCDYLTQWLPSFPVVSHARVPLVCPRRQQRRQVLACYSRAAAASLVTPGRACGGWQLGGEEVAQPPHLLGQQLDVGAGAVLSGLDALHDHDARVAVTPPSRAMPASRRM